MSHFDCLKNGIYFSSQEQIAYFLTQQAVYFLVHFKFLRVYIDHPITKNKTTQYQEISMQNYNDSTCSLICRDQICALSTTSVLTSPCCPPSKKFIVINNSVQWMSVVHNECSTETDNTDQHCNVHHKKVDNEHAKSSCAPPNRHKAMLCTSRGHRPPLCTMVHNAGWWCTT